MSRFPVSATVIAGIYFASMASRWWWVVYIFGVVASVPAFVYLLFNSSGRRTYVSFLLMFIPVVGGLLAIGRLLRGSGPQVLLGLALWTIPLMTYDSSGAERVIIFALVSLVLCALLGLVSPYRYNPALTAVSCLALPTIFFILGASIVAPFLSSSADVDLAVTDDDSSLVGHGQWANDGAPFDVALDSWSPIDGYSSPQTISGSPDLGHDSLLPDVSGSNGIFSEVNAASDGGLQNAFDEGTPVHGDADAGTGHGGGLEVSSEIHTGGDVGHYEALAGGTAEFSTDDADLGHSEDFVVSEVRIDPLTDSLSFETSDGTISLTESQITGRLSGQLPDGGGLEIWSDQVTGDIKISSGEIIQAYRHDPITDSWLSVGERGVHRIDSDPITGEIRVHAPGGTAKFRIDPFSNRIIPS